MGLILTSMEQLRLRDDDENFRAGRLCAGFQKPFGGPKLSQ